MSPINNMKLEEAIKKCEPKLMTGKSEHPSSPREQLSIEDFLWFDIHGYCYRL